MILAQHIPVAAQHAHEHGGSFLDLAWHTLVDTAPMIPVLFILYFLLEYLWHHRGLDVLSLTRINGAWGPLIGTMLGLIPQCGMSVFVTSLYVGRRITLGTLVATYLATSDEAIPVMLAHGGLYTPILGLLGVKAVIGIVAGYAVDLVMRRRHYAGEVRPAKSQIVATIEHEMHAAPWKEVLVHSTRRTGEIFAWVYGVTLVIGFGLSYMHAEDIVQALGVHPMLEVAVIGAFGLIPNCGASIAIAEAYIHAGLSYGATLAGLSAGAGYGPIVLFKEGNKPHALRVMLLCLALAITAGLLL